jgi:hypothetical protein
MTWTYNDDGGGLNEGLIRYILCFLGHEWKRLCGRWLNHRADGRDASRRDEGARQHILEQFAAIYGGHIFAPKLFGALADADTQ